MHKTEVLTSQKTRSTPIRKKAAKEIFDIQGESIPHEKKKHKYNVWQSAEFLNTRQVVHIFITEL